MFGNFLFNIVQYCKQDNTLDVASYSKTVYSHSKLYTHTYVLIFEISLGSRHHSEGNWNKSSIFFFTNIIGVGDSILYSLISFLSFLLSFSVLLRCQLWLRTCCRIRLHEPESQHSNQGRVYYLRQET